MTLRVVAVDWSGRAKGVRKHLWLAEVVDGQVLRLESGRDREELIDHLISYSAAHSELVVGLDFAFGLPSWFAAQIGATSIEDVWRNAQQNSETWLRDCAPPFWGRPGKGKPMLEEHFRLTEKRLAPVTGISPKSTLQIGGAGAVGTGTLRGLPALHRLHGGGFAIWPFHPVRLPLVVEIYPRTITGAVNKSSKAERERYLERYTELSTGFRDAAANSEDAFDALVSAIEMWQSNESFLNPQKFPSDDIDVIQMEGWIWSPTHSMTR